MLSVLLACSRAPETPATRTEPCVERTWAVDADGDGFGDPDATTVACDAPTGHVEAAGDCDDADPDVFPGAQDDLATARDDDCVPDRVTATPWGDDLGAVLDLVGDVDGDGDQEVALACDGGLCLASDGTAAILLTAGAGAARAGDLDGDGTDDLWTADPPANEILLWSGGPSPVERARVVGPADGAMGSSLLAFGGDVLAVGAAQVWLVSADPGPGVHAVEDVAASTLQLPAPVVARSAGDFDGDGLDDAVVREALYDPHLNGTEAYTGIWTAPDLAGDLALRSFGRSDAPPVMDGVGDVDGDGYDDVVVADDAVALLLPGSADAWLDGSAAVATFQQTLADAAGADVDGDGAVDIVVGAASDDDPVLVYLGPVGGGLWAHDADTRWAVEAAASGRVLDLGDPDGDGAHAVLASADERVWQLGAP